MASATTTATVETLTAEVRVLAVGNRQITLSVAKQLDFAPLDKLTVFGRVKLGGSYADDLVIGSDASGSLALARYGHYVKLPDWRACLEIDPDWPVDERPEVGWDIKEFSRYEPYHGCFGLSFSEPGIPVAIKASQCRVRDGRREYLKAHSDWITARNNGSEAPEPSAGDYGGHRWSPGPHWAELEQDARNQLAEAERQHRLYEAAKSAPLIVLAGLK